MARRPSFIAESATSITDIRPILLHLEHSRKIEQALVEKLPAEYRAMSLARIEALDTMRGDTLAYLQWLRRKDEEPNLAGFKRGDRIEIPSANHQSATVFAFEPTFDPTHIVALTDAGEELTVHPSSVVAIPED